MTHDLQGNIVYDSEDFIVVGYGEKDPKTWAFEIVRKVSDDSTPPMLCYAQPQSALAQLITKRKLKWETAKLPPLQEEVERFFDRCTQVCLTPLVIH